MALTAAAPDRMEAIATRSAVCLDGLRSGARFMARNFIPALPLSIVAPSLLALASAVNRFYMDI
jgi:hypothetical protein